MPGIISVVGGCGHCVVVGIKSVVDGGHGVVGVKSVGDVVSAAHMAHMSSHFGLPGTKGDVSAHKAQKSSHFGFPGINSVVEVGSSGEFVGVVDEGLV